MSRKSVDDRVMRDVADEWREISWVAGVSIRPWNKPNKVVVTLESDYYPQEVRQVAVEFEIHVSGDFFVTYHEVWERETDDYRCRWDRHENDHNARDHYHEPPDCETAVDREFPKYPFQMTEIVLRFVERRRGTAFKESSAG